MAERNKRALKEYRVFEAARPRLMRGRYRGRWVVFLDGKVQSDHDDELEAFEAGVKAFGVETPFVIGAVRKPVPVTLGPVILTRARRGRRIGSTTTP
jgi:hypothetical protein